MERYEINRDVVHVGNIRVTELWSTKREGNPLHRLCAYQGSYPPQLPAFFIEKYGNDAKVILDPFCGRGTTLLEATLAGREAIGIDMLPTARVLSTIKIHCRPREEVIEEIVALDIAGAAPPIPANLAPFFHADTWTQVYNLKHASISYEITALALGRLHGHSTGFFSAKTFNAISVSAESLARSQAKHGTRALPRDVKKILIKAAKKFIPINGLNGCGGVIAGDARAMPLPSNSIDMIITSPPFLDAINYNDTNWLRNWFVGHDEGVLHEPLLTGNREEYKAFTSDYLLEVKRVLKRGAYAVVEVGPIKKNMNLENVVIESSKDVGLELVEVVVHSFENAAVPKISRAMTGGARTTTMENRCVVMRKI